MLLVLTQCVRKEQRDAFAELVKRMDEGGSTQYSHEDETTIEMLNRSLAKNVDERLNSGA